MNSKTTKSATKLLSKVPEITLYFWIIKVLCTTTGETFSDFLNVNLNFGLVGTSILMGIALLITLFFQFRTKKYTPSIYWTTVVLISVFGTLVTDNLTDKMQIPLQYSTILFSALLALTFAIWYKNEKNLSIHSIFTKRRELFYWLAILFTFALGTASGDLMAEGLALGYSLTGIIICVVIFTIAIAWKMGMNSILSFWLIYIMTRPLGAAFWDYLSQPAKYGWIGLGATNTSIIFLLAISALVTFLTLTKEDSVTPADIAADEKEKGGLRHTVTALMILSIVSGVGYFWRQNVLSSPLVGPENPPTISNTVTSTGSGKITTKIVSALGDLSTFRTITEDTLALVNTGDIPGAVTRVWDLEHEWDIAQTRLKSMNQMKWTEIDGKIDKVLRQLRAVNKNTADSKTALEALLVVLN